MAKQISGNVPGGNGAVPGRGLSNNSGSTRAAKLASENAKMKGYSGKSATPSPKNKKTAKSTLMEYNKIVKYKSPDDARKAATKVPVKKKK
jgi:hypothetical protein